MRRFISILSFAAATTAVAAAAGAILASHLTLNVTTSMPRGLYWLRPEARPSRGSIVSLAVPSEVATLVAERRYLPPDYHLLKRVVALEGDFVCLAGARYVVGERLVSDVADSDRFGQPLPPPYPFCGIVNTGVAYVAGAGASSLDSRYFGPLSITDLTTAVPLWTSY